jgi:CheY-like chemotaxis protein
MEGKDAVRTLISMAPQKQVYSVLRAKNGGEGLLLCEQHAGIDRVITDVNLPQMSGGELAARLKTRCPGMKVLFLSGYGASAIVASRCARSRYGIAS